MSRRIRGLILVGLVYSTAIDAPLHAQATDLSGRIRADHWLALGPFLTTVGCNGDASSSGLYANHIGPDSHIACEVPRGGEPVVGFDAGAPGNVTESLDPEAPQNAQGEPQWYAWDNSVPGSSEIQLVADPDGNFDDRLMWLATYVEYLGEEPIVAELCVGSDDDFQVWFDDRLVANRAVCRGRGVCQDVVPVQVTPGIHVIKFGVWNGGGGWGGSVGIRVDGAMIRDPHPDWSYLGREGGDFSLDGCDSDDVAPYDAPALECVRLAERTVVSWEPHPDTSAEGQFEVFVDGRLAAEVASDRDRYEVEIAGESEVICLRSPGGQLVCDRCEMTDSNGFIQGGAWLALGPFAHSQGCGPNAAELLGNWIAPSSISCEYPVEGDAVAVGYDPEIALTLRLHPDAAADDEGTPVWYPYFDGDGNGELNFDRVVGDLSNHMMWVATYVEYVGRDADVPIQICIGSDDSAQVWVNDEVVLSRSVCRGRGGAGSCQDTVEVRLPGPGVYCIRMGIWEGGGGWGGRLGLRDRGGPITSDHPDFVFHGRRRPDGFEAPECTYCPPVTNLTCVPNDDGGLDLSWRNEDTCEAETIQILVDGGSVAELDGDATSFTLDADLVPIVGNVEIDNGADVPSACQLPETEHFTSEGFIKSWLMLGPLEHAGGAAPGCEAIQLDYLTDGEDVFEDVVEPREGESIDTDFDEAASLGLAATPDVPELNPDGIPTWLAHFNSDDTIYYNTEFYGADINNVMVYSAFYVTVPREITVDIGVASDDSIQVLIDGESVHCRSVPRGVGPSNHVQDVIPGVRLSEGIHLIMVKVFEGGGGHGHRFRFQRGGAPILPGVISLEPDPIEVNCDDGEDGDGDGDVDCADSDCESAASCRGGFVRGDANSNGVVGLTDGIVILNFLFRAGSEAPDCMSAADIDDDGRLGLSDAVRVFDWLFRAGAGFSAPAPSVTSYPREECGRDPTPDALTCESFAATCE